MQSSQHKLTLRSTLPYDVLARPVILRCYPARTNIIGNSNFELGSNNPILLLLLVDDADTQPRVNLQQQPCTCMRYTPIIMLTSLVRVSEHFFHFVFFSVKRLSFVLTSFMQPCSVCAHACANAPHTVHMHVV